MEGMTGEDHELLQPIRDLIATQTEELQRAGKRMLCIRNQPNLSYLVRASDWPGPTYEHFDTVDAMREAAPWKA